MSIADKLTQLTNIRSNIRTKLTEKGVEASEHDFKDFASDIASIQTGITPTGSINITENGTYDVTNKAEAVVNVSGGGGGVEVTVVSDIATRDELKAFLESSSPSFGECFFEKVGHPKAPSASTYEASGGIVIDGVCKYTYRTMGHDPFNIFTSGSSSARTGSIFQRFDF